MTKGKKDIINALYLQAKHDGQVTLTRDRIAYLYDSIFKLFHNSLVKEGQKVRVCQFGTFTPKIRKDHRIRDIDTGKNRIVPAHRVVTFRASAKLR